MNYTFKTKEGKDLKIFYNDLFVDKDNYGIVTFFKTTGNKCKEIKKDVKKDESGRLYFFYNREKLFMDEFKAYTPEELIGLTNMRQNDLCHTLIKYGLDSLHVLMRVKKLDIIDMGVFGRLAFETNSPFDTDEDYVWIEYEFVDEYLRNPKNGYKLKLKPVKMEDRELYPTKDYYVEDLVSLLRKCKDKFKLVTKS